MRLLILILALAVTGCSSPSPTRSTPGEAFARLAPCVDRADTGCLFDELNRDSRWSVHSIFRTLQKGTQLAKRSYPEGERDKVFGRWSNEAKAQSARELFGIYCREGGCLKALAKGFGAVVKEEKVGEGRVKITTTRDGVFLMAQAEGEWGLADHQEKLQAAKIKLADDLKQIERNAAAFDEQRTALGADENGENQ